MNILIVLAGIPPSKSLLSTEMENAELTVAVDGGISAFESYDLKPDIVIGDMDASEPKDQRMPILRMEDQEHTDLQKTLNYLLDTHKVESLIILGGGGIRVDHTIHNLYICSSIDSTIKIVFKNEISVDGRDKLETIHRITPQSRFDLPIKNGDTISILPITTYEGLSTSGLQWDIKNRDSGTGLISQSNIATKADPRFSVRSGCAYIVVYQ